MTDHRCRVLVTNSTGGIDRISVQALPDPMGKIVPEAVVELGDDQACVMIRSDFSYQLTYERCDGGAHLKSLAR